MRIILILLVVSVYVANATTYYVSSSGSDANNGTSTSTPWGTIWKIGQVSFQPGDSVLLKRGDVWYEQFFLDSLYGTAGNLITIAAYGSGSRPKIDCAMQGMTWNAKVGYPGVYWCYSPQTAIRFAAQYYNGAWRMLQGQAHYGTEPDSWLDSFADSSFGSWYNTQHYDTVWVHTINDIAWNADSMFVTRASNDFWHCKFVMLRDFEVTNTGYSGIALEHDSTVTLRNVKVHQTWGAGIWVGSASTGGMAKSYHVVIDSCDVDSTGDSSIYLSQSYYGRVAYNDCNMVYDTVGGLPFGGGDQGCLGIQGRNTSKSMEGWGGLGNLIEYNTFNNGPDALDGFYQLYDTIRCNVFTNAGGGLYPNGKWLTVEYNVVSLVGGGNGGGMGRVGIDTLVADTNYFRYNTIQNAGVTGCVIQGGPNTFVVAAHNIISGGGAGNGITHIHNVAPQYASVDSNSYCGTPTYERFGVGGTYPGDPAITYSSFAAYQVAGYEPYSTFTASCPSSPDCPGEIVISTHIRRMLTKGKH